MAFLRNILGEFNCQFWPKTKYLIKVNTSTEMKTSLLNEIYPFDNSVNPYSSISGHTFENRSSEKPASDAF